MEDYSDNVSVVIEEPINSGMMRAFDHDQYDPDMLRAKYYNGKQSRGKLWMYYDGGRQEADYGFVCGWWRKRCQCRQCYRPRFRAPRRECPCTDYLVPFSPMSYESDSGHFPYYGDHSGGCGCGRRY